MTSKKIFGGMVKHAFWNHQKFGKFDDKRILAVSSAKGGATKY